MATGFKIETQEKLNWCWAAVAATVSHYFFPDQPLQQVDIAKSVLHLAAGIDCNAPGSACDQPAPLEQAFGAVEVLAGRSLGMRPPSSGTLLFHKVQAQIDAGKPVCVRVQWFDETRGHFVMISGYSISDSGEEWVDVADPYYEDSTIPYEQFVHAYLDAGAWTNTYLLKQ
jgi:hypothetical protein